MTARAATGNTPGGSFVAVWARIGLRRASAKGRGMGVPRQLAARYGAGVDVFNALVRQIDRKDPSFKT